MKKINIKGSNDTVYEYKHDSGLRVYVWASDICDEISMTLTTKFGSIHTDYEVANQKYHLPSGVAHFLEHVKFNEKKGVTAHDFYYQNGSYTNAYTTFDHTSYEVICTDNLKLNLEHLLYFVFNSYFTKELVQKEKQIIIEEAKSRLDDPYSTGYFSLLNGIYQHDNRKNLVTGNPEDIKDITLEDVENAFNHFYHPENMFLIVTGNVFPDEIKEVVDNYFIDKAISKYQKPKIIKEKEPQKVNIPYQEIKANVKRDKVFYALKIPKKHFPKISELELALYLNLVNLCNFGTTNEFVEKMIKEKIVDEIEASKVINDENVIVSFILSTDCPKNALAKLKEKLNNLEISKDTFKRKIKNTLVGIILAFEHAAYVNEDLRLDIVKYDHLIDNYYDLIKNAKYEMLIEVMNSIKNYDEATVVLKENSKA